MAHGQWHRYERCKSTMYDTLSEEGRKLVAPRTFRRWLSNGEKYAWLARTGEVLFLCLRKTTLICMLNSRLILHTCLYSGGHRIEDDHR